MNEDLKPTTLHGKLVHLIEECSEVIKEASKSLRFGIDSTNPVTGTSTIESLKSEISDVEIAAREVLAEVSSKKKQAIECRRICIVESPFRGETKDEESRNRAYLDKAIRWCVLHGYTPYASHKMLPDALDDSNEEERTTGINAGIEMSLSLLNSNKMARVFFFTDYSWSCGMLKAQKKYTAHHFEDRIECLSIEKL